MGWGSQFPVNAPRNCGVSAVEDYRWDVHSGSEFDEVAGLGVALDWL